MWLIHPSPNQRTQSASVFSLSTDPRNSPQNFESDPENKKKKMPKAERGTPKDIANRMKAKGASLTPKTYKTLKVKFKNLNYILQKRI